MPEDGGGRIRPRVSTAGGIAGLLRHLGCLELLELLQPSGPHRVT